MRWPGFTVGILQRFVRSRWRRRSLYALAGLIVLTVLFYAEEDFRGKRAWENYKREWEAKGERFDAASIIPPPVPDDQNFAMAPIVASMYAGYMDRNGRLITPPNTNIIDRLDLRIYGSEGLEGANQDWQTYERTYPWLVKSYWPSNGLWQLGRKTDVEAWQLYYRNPPAFIAAKMKSETARAAKRGSRRGSSQQNSNPPTGAIPQERETGSRVTNEFPIPTQPQSPGADVLLALSKYYNAIEELREASHRPRSRFPVSDQAANILVSARPYGLVPSSEVLELRAVAELSLSKTDKAWADLKLIFRLAESLRLQPSSQSQLARIDLVGLALQPIWEGLVERRWSEANLAEVEGELGDLDFLSDCAFVARAQRMRVFDYIDTVRKDRGSEFTIEEYDGPKDYVEVFALRHIPCGWYYQNEVSACRAYTEELLPTLDLTNHTVRRQFDEPSFWSDSFNPFNPYKFLARAYFTPVKTGKFEHAQATVNLALAACALERHWLKYGEYPDKLEALAPEFIAQLPHDVMTGKPLHYRRTANGRFALYSAGWGGLDHHGVVKMTENRYLAGDWVWQYP